MVLSELHLCLFSETVERYGPKKDKRHDSESLSLDFQQRPEPYNLETTQDLINLLHLRPKDGDGIELDLSLLGQGVTPKTNMNDDSSSAQQLITNDSSDSNANGGDGGKTLASLQEELNRAAASVTLSNGFPLSCPSPTAPPDSIRSLHLETKNKGFVAAQLFSSTQSDLVEKTAQGSDCCRLTGSIYLDFLD